MKAIKLVSLMINVVVSDQYGTTKDIFIGVFDQQLPLEKARKSFEKKYRNKQHSFTEKIIKVNEYQS